MRSRLGNRAFGELLRSLFAAPADAGAPGVLSGQIPARPEALLGSPGRPLGAESRRHLEARFAGPPMTRVAQAAGELALGRADDAAEAAAERAAGAAAPGPGARPAELGRIRIHTGARAAQAARTLGARAFSLGDDIVFGEAQYRPDTPEGSRLLAHELAHAIQARGQARPTLRRQPQPGARSGSERVAYSIKIPPGISSREQMVRYAETVIFGRPVHLAWKAERSETEAALSDPGRNVGKALDFKLAASELVKHGGAPSAEAKAAADRAYAELDPTERLNLDLEIDRRYYAGMGVPQGTEIKRGERGKAQVWHGFKRQVLAERRKLDALPPAVKSLLGAEEGFDPATYEVMLRLAGKLEPLSEADLKDFRSHIEFDATDLALLEAGIDRYLADRGLRAQAYQRREDLVRRLYGTEKLYEELKRIGRASAELEKKARDKNVQGAGHEANALRLQAAQLRQTEIADFTPKVTAHGFESIQDYVQTIDAYEKAFLGETVAITFGILQKLEHRLWEYEQQYRKPGAIDALMALVRATGAPQMAQEAGKKVHEARALSERGRFQTVQGNAGEGNRLSNEAGRKMNEAGALMARARGHVQSVPGHPLVSDEKFPRDALLSTDRGEVQAAVFRYIQGRRDDAAKSRGHLRDDPRIVYKLPRVLAPSLAQQEIEPGTVFHNIIDDRARQYARKDELLHFVLAVVAFALGLATGGAGAVAVVAAMGALGIGAYQAVMEYREYEQQSAFAGAGLADDPSFAWVIVAVVAAGLDLGVAVKAVHGLKGAVTAFNRSGDLAALKGSVEHLPERVRQSVLRAAVAKLEADEALLKFGSKVGSSLNAGLAGLNAMPDLALALYRMGKRGVFSFGRFMQEMKAAKLIDEARLTGAELKRLKDMFDEARQVVVQVDEAGKALGLTEKEIGAFVKQMAADPALTVAEVKAAMENAAQTRQIAAATEGTGAAARRGRAPLDVKAQVKAAERLERTQREMAEKVLSIRAENDAAAAARKDLKALAETPKPLPDSLKTPVQRIEKLKSLEERIEAIEELARKPGLTDAEKDFVEWRRRAWTLQHEAEQAEETSRHLSRRLDDLAAQERAAVAQVREQSKDLIELMRQEGPNYAKKSAVMIDEVLGADAWKALPSPRPKLATDHLVALDRVSKRPELNRLLALYTEASDAVKAQIRAELKGLGDVPENLVRMNAKANGSKLKSNKSWHDITYEEAKGFGYGSRAVDDIRLLEDKALATILKRIEALTDKYSVLAKGKGTPAP